MKLRAKHGTYLPKILAALPGTSADIAARTGIDRREVQKCLSNAKRRDYVRQGGTKGREHIWVSGDGTPKAKGNGAVDTPPQPKPARLLIYLDSLEARIKNLEQIVGVR